MIRCPSLTRQSTQRRSVSRGAWTTLADVVGDPLDRAPRVEAASGRADVALSMFLLEQAADLVEDRRGDAPSAPSRCAARRRGRRASPRSRSRRSRCPAFYVVEDDEVDVLVVPLRPRALESMLADVRGEADEDSAVRRAGAELARTSTVGLSASVHASPSFGRLPWIGRPVVRHGRGHDHDVGVRAARAPRARGRRRSVSATSSTPAGAGTARLAARSVTSAPRRRASAASATPIRPEERLPTKRTASIGSRVPPAETTTRRPAQLVGPAEKRPDALVDLLGLGHPAHAPLALAGVPLVGADQLDAARAERLRVGLRRRVRPHARVHRGRDEERPAVRERRLGEDGVGEAVGELRERVRRARRDHEQVGARRGAGRGRRRAACGRAPRRSRA